MGEVMTSKKRKYISCMDVKKNPREGCNHSSMTVPLTTSFLSHHMIAVFLLSNPSRTQ